MIICSTADSPVSRDMLSWKRNIIHAIFMLKYCQGYLVIECGIFRTRSASKPHADANLRWSRRAGHTEQVGQRSYYLRDRVDSVETPRLVHCSLSRSACRPPSRLRRMYRTYHIRQGLITSNPQASGLQLSRPCAHESMTSGLASSWVSWKMVNGRDTNGYTRERGVI
ncbi:hypothetical protein BD779DRAFT_315105 [Infundibulicybe gibba]|nr:hypothetical protein BD779DRAFT_315105 [Infundibulicybe gibba]